MGLVAALPVAPYLLTLLGAGVPRFGLFGDVALLEQATRHAWTGGALLGPYSRFHWHHPGPLFFFLVAPFQRAFAPSSTGLYVGTCFVCAASAAALVASTRLLTQRAHAVAALLAVLAWFAAFGNVSANPWNPLVVTLPLMTFLVGAAMLAQGKAAAAPIAAVFGSLAAQTHIATVSTVVVCSLGALVAFSVHARRRRDPGAGPWLERRARRQLLAAAALALVVWAPPIFEQVTAEGDGNLTLVTAFFRHPPSPRRPWGDALGDWATATSWLPDRVARRSLGQEAYLPMVTRWDAMPARMTATTWAFACARLVLMAIAAVVAVRRRDHASVALVAMGALADVVACSSLRAIVGTSFYYLVFWTTAGSTIGWLGVLSAAACAARDAAIARPRLSTHTPRAVVLAGLVACVATSALQTAWLSRSPGAPMSYPLARDALREVHADLRAELGDDRTAVVHVDGAWDVAQAMVLELEKDGLDVRVPSAERWLYAAVRAPDGAPRPLHVWFSTGALPLPPALARCVEPSARRGDIAMFTSGVAVPVCD
jgi:hypothetical protein